MSETKIVNKNGGRCTYRTWEMTWEIWSIIIWVLRFHFSVGRLKLQDRKMQDWKMTDKFAGVENAGLEIDGQKLQGVENDGHSIKR